jgi:ubiquinone/menaquinone biosynthesis C-methylase UbiE
MRDVRNAFPRLPVVASDLSEPYLSRARRELASRPGSGAVCAAGENLPFHTGAFDVVTNIYLFHELPPKIRPLVAAEMARAVAPGGRVVVVDSLQTGDDPELDGILELFPQLFHEPYYRSYLTLGVEQLFAEVGLQSVATWPAFVSKVFVFRKPEVG